MHRRWMKRKLDKLGFRENKDAHPNRVPTGRHAIAQGATLGRIEKLN